MLWTGKEYKNWESVIMGPDQSGLFYLNIL